MKKLGFIDYYLDEWHANNYFPWIKEGAQELNEEFEVCYAYGEIDSPIGGISSEEWCKKNNVELCKTIEEICEKSDYLFILAPSNPERHLDLAKKVLPYGKTTYIDKTFAYNLEEAKEIYKIANQYGTKIFSSSALRFADEWTGYEKVDSLLAFGTGGSFYEYSVHIIEITVRLMGIGADSITVISSDKFNTVVKVDYKDGRSVVINYSNAWMPYAVCVVDKGEVKYLSADSHYFKNLLKSILKFFLTGEAPFDYNQTLEVMAIRDACLKGIENVGKTIKI